MFGFLPEEKTPSIVSAPTAFKVRNNFILRRCYTRWFATLLQYCFEGLQHCSNIAKLCSAKNRRCESYCVTSPLTDDDDEGSENVANIATNLRPFKLYRVYLDQLNLWNVGGFSLRWILKGFNQLKKVKGKFVVACSRPP